MRVIAGEHRGRRLTAVPGKGTRPTTDKIKESIFNMIGPYFSGGWVLDLYAGTGGLGIEALSRGMDKAVFVEKDLKAFSVVKQNVAACRLEDRAELYRNDAGRALKLLAKRGVVFDLVFLDPPYAHQRIAEEMMEMQALRLLAEDAWIVAEHDSGFRLPERVGACEQDRVSTYGETTITIYRFDQVGEPGEAEDGSPGEEGDEVL
ncbi:16S rRNA (guanine(966)-N(2))-methyltransferase RsmD [Brevibacillus composti]|uniref:16S rRNA (Guanine(966)-N(2))-methyltransferase RsmD n=1 Tax=Brevibacillus composti TaxID=2796470 RepID=A0A7T5ENV7_9BACL|nr:16S rRNA (guanine(966)-N(2))-methyltransferase RsmD [Brevibacillus composti]QQE76069.1 16S rRNA (guanine(966)-N(2))-methyltransferase RsmD [Brevibacillus composti]QUO43097.1 16S rRNA (guanine(966)-N(2))-methyltransferase RsmD [Brevibacillus composti]